MFLSATIKTAEGFEDKHGFFEALSKWSGWAVGREEGAPIPNFNLKHADGKLTLTMSMALPKEE
jgi:hypothetical protein